MPIGECVRIHAGNAIFHIRQDFCAYIKKISQAVWLRLVNAYDKEDSS